MKKLILTALLAGMVSAASSAQLSLADRMLLRGQKLEQRGVMDATSLRKAAPAASSDHKTFAFVKLAEGFAPADLEAEGVAVVSRFGDIVAVAVPTDDVERVASLPAVARMELSRQRSAMMDNARKASGVAPIHEGAELDHPYTGAGVIVGVVDQGLDPNHINFRGEDGRSRIGYLGHTYIDSKSQDGWSGVQYDRDNIWRFTTDTDETYHGTHTLGILAGGWRGKIEAAVADDDVAAHIESIDNPYYGVAYGADIAANCGDLVDMLIAQGIDGVLNYRYAMQKPCVLSLSLGSNTGSHSPKALMNQVLDMVAEECIVVLAAGNEGDVPLALKKTLAEGDTEAKTFILPTYRDDVRYGQVFFYSDRKFKMQAVIYNKTRKTVAYRMPVEDSQQQGVARFYCSAEYQEDASDIVTTNFSNRFTGYVGVGWDKESYSGEYMAQISYYTENNPTLNADGNYILGFVVEGEPGQSIECYCDGQFTALDDYDQPGWDDGTTDGTISDMACGNDVLVVGSYNTREMYPALDGYMYNYQGMCTPGKVTPFSSYATLADGRKLPHVCAPGAAIVSSTSTYYCVNPDNQVGLNGLVAKVEEADRPHFWAPSLGTSMATPFVAGSIALWLEADPTLTIDAVKEIIAETSVRDADVEAGNPVQWGAGKFDAYAGLKEVLRRSSGVTDVKADESPLMVSRSGRVCTVFVNGAERIDARVYGVAGTEVLAAACDGDELAIDMSALEAGIYLLNVNGTYSRKIVIK